MICNCSYYIDCPYLYEICYAHVRLPVDDRESCPYCNEKCYKKEGKEE